MTALPGAACSIPTGRGRGKSDGVIKQVKTAVLGGFVVTISFPVRLFYIEKNLYKVERGISMRRFSRGDLYFANLNARTRTEKELQLDTINVIISGTNQNLRNRGIENVLLYWNRRFSSQCAY